MKEIILPVIIASLGSTGLFTFIQFIITQKSIQTKILKCLLYEELWRKVEKHRDKKSKTKQDDLTFQKYLELYIREGNGASDTLANEWNKIAFEE